MFKFSKFYLVGTNCTHMAPMSMVPEVGSLRE